MKATNKQKKAFDKAFDQQWRRLFVHLMERKNVLLTDVLRDHELKSVSPTEIEFFEDLARDGLLYYLKSFYEENKTELMKGVENQDALMLEVNIILHKKR